MLHFTHHATPTVYSFTKISGSQSGWPGPTSRGTDVSAILACRPASQTRVCDRGPGSVEPGFSINVKALHRRPDPNCGLLRATSYHRDIYVFHNAHMVPPIFEGPGLEALCGETTDG